MEINNKTYNENECLVDVNFICNNKFIIPKYQRGYRWSKSQIEELITDLLQFGKDISESPNINNELESRICYLLQNLIVKKTIIDGESYFIVVDGQQRLTTLYLLLRCYNNSGVKFKTNLCSIQYAKNNKTIEELISVGNKNVDSYYLNEAIKLIDKILFENKIDIIDLYKDIIKNKVKFIFHNIETNIDERKSFTNVNMGKIPLTDSELIKATILQEKSAILKEKNTDTSNIANEWNKIEEELHNDEFFKFFTNNSDLYSRIGIIFDIYASIRFDNEERLKDKLNRGDKLFTYFVIKDEIDKLHNAKKNIIEIWNEIIKYYSYIKDWYSDRKLYHYIGYLLFVSEDKKRIDELLKDSEIAKNKNELIIKIKKQIEHDLLFKGDRQNYSSISELLDEISYEEDCKRIKDILLLFNILIVLEDLDNERFSFNKYKNDGYDVEHIHPRCDKTNQMIDKIKWLMGLSSYIKRTNDCTKYVKGLDLFNKIIQDIELMKSKNCNDVTIERYIRDSYAIELKKYFDKEQQEFFNSFKIGVFDINKIGNLVLLNASINRGYGNHVYPIKLDKIKEHNATTKFIPIATRNAIFKYYSDADAKANVFQWTDGDSKCYQKAIQKYLERFINT